MNYCRNCGKECRKKICPHCGTNARKGVKYCGWCGEEFDMYVIVCPNCHERLEVSFMSKLLGMIGTLLGIFFFFGAVLMLLDRSFISSALNCLAGILLMPFTKNILRRCTLGKKGVRAFLVTARVILIIGLIIGVAFATPKPEYKISVDEATEAAVSVFHDEVHLKNEASFMLNDSKVYYNENYNGDKNKALVTVILDYSAENSLGGMNREEYTVELVFNYTDGKYYLPAE